MADRNFSEIGWLQRPRRGVLLRIRRIGSVGLAGGLLISCGTTAQPGTGAISPSSTIATTTTTTTIPPETTTTIDFNRPVNQQTTPLPEEALIADLAEVTNDMRGQTEDVYQQMIRLVDFPKLASPIGAQVLDFRAVMRPEDDQLRTESAVTLRAPNNSIDLVEYFAAELEARVWNDADVAKELTDEGERTTTIFRDPGFSGEEKELTVTVETKPGLVLIDLEHHSLVDADSERYELLQSWQTKVTTPRSAEVVEVGISTADNVGTAVVTHHLDAETAAEARSDVLAAVRTSEFDTTAVPVEGDSSPVILIDVETGEEFRLEFAETLEEDIIEMTVTATFPLTPLD